MLCIENCFNIKGIPTVVVCLFPVFVAEDEALTDPDFFKVGKLFTMRELFDAGVHYGHHEGCWSPLMKPYLYGTREHMHIIDLNETVKHLKVSQCHIYSKRDIQSFQQNAATGDLLYEMGQKLGKIINLKRSKYQLLQAR